MKTLFILRHAKSSWDHPNLSDFERPLNKRGKKAAPFIGELMAKRNLAPEIILSSSAERARQTAFLAKKSGDFVAEIRFDDRIYGASTNTLMYLVSRIEDRFESAMIVGHNPGLESLVALLCGEYKRLTTANLALIDLEIIGWHEVSKNFGTMRTLLRPKDHM